jgi:hypothetical protein
MQQGYPLILEAKKLTDHDFPVIPLNDKIPIIEYEHRRNQLATISETELWFSNSDGRVPKANGIAIAINNTEFGIDIDGEKCESAFLNKIVSSLPIELQDKIGKTMHTKTPHGHHRMFRVLSQDFPHGIKEKIIAKSEGHNEIAVKGNNHILFERGPGYEIVNDVDCIVSLSKQETMQLLNALDNFRVRTNGVKTIVGTLIPYYTNGRRDNLVFALSGYLHKKSVSESLIFEIVESLVSQANDEDSQARLQVVKDTCSKDANSDQVSGYNRLLEALDNNQNAVSDIEQVLNELGLGTFNSSRRKNPQSDEGRNGHDRGEVAAIDPSIDLDPYIPDKDYAEYFIKVVKRTVRREDSFVRQVFYTALSKDSDSPLNLGVLATTSWGKTYGIIQTLQYFQDKSIWYIGSMSPKVIIRQHGVLVDSNSKPLKPRLQELKKLIKDNEDSKNEQEVERLKGELEELKATAKVLIRLQGLCLVFLEPPHKETWNILKATLSHDRFEIEHPHVYDVPSSGFTVKNIVTRGWPSCIFASARNESRWDMWPEIQSRFLVVSPNIVPEKVHEGNILIGQSMSLPDRIKHKIIISLREKELARKCANYLMQQVKANMTQESASLSLTGRYGSCCNAYLYLFFTTFIAFPKHCQQVHSSPVSSFPQMVSPSRSKVRSSVAVSAESPPSKLSTSSTSISSSPPLQSLQSTFFEPSIQVADLSPHQGLSGHGKDWMDWAHHNMFLNLHFHRHCRLHL